MSDFILPDDFDIEKMEKLIYDQYHIIELYNNSKMPFSSPEDIKKIEFQGLLFAARIEVTICFKYLLSGVKKYEGCFFLNIAFMKMYEIMDLVRKVNTDKTNRLYYNPQPDSKEEILKIYNEWKKEYGKSIHTKRNHSTAHYQPNFLEYMKDGYMSIDAKKNQECFLFFFRSLESILCIMKKYDPIILSS